MIHICVQITTSYHKVNKDMNLHTLFQRPQHTLTHSEVSSGSVELIENSFIIPFTLMVPVLQWDDIKCKQHFLQPLVSAMCVQLAAFMNTLLYIY